ncbi:hypothetical protein ACFQHV_01060 [Promicromonospora thailandica]|uniref:HNH endonuclease n=1 Tax=Promicromonospora thailandica TaxID=765201 RepID=A0A9X2G592_9MICO|nr:hypothetical protein [Promicromonospora thailandica]MCP2265557.1 hypothetical protein [Promicromonospora thailandica]
MQLQGAPGADERTVNEVFGWIMRCAFQSAAHLTDYVIDAGTAYMLGGARTDELVRLCVAAGLLTETTTSNGIRAWTMLQDPEFIHIRLRQEIEWERQQRNDTRDPALTVPVRRRDGDNCRWCGVLVQWRGKKTNRTATLDHLVPGEAAAVATLVVACLGCNSARKDNAELWADNHTIRPEPPRPNYGKWTAKFLTDNGWPTQENVRSDDESATVAAAGTARPDQAVRPAAPPAARPALDDPPAGAEPPPEASPKSAPNSISQVDGTSSAGSGRDGSGSPTGAPTGGRRRRRGKRGGKSRNDSPAVPREDPPAWVMEEMEGGAA